MAGSVLWRVYFAGGAHPVAWDTFRHFGPTNSRFDHHPPPPSVQSHGVLYGAENGPTCLAEVFQQTRVIDRSRDAPWLVSFATMRDLTLLSLRDTWPTRAGASMAINTGRRDRARRWSQSCYKAYPAIDGLWYSSSMHGNKPAVALYERAISAMPAHPTFHRALADAAIYPALSNAAASVGYLLV